MFNVLFSLLTKGSFSSPPAWPCWWPGLYVEISGTVALPAFSIAGPCSCVMASALHGPEGSARRSGRASLAFSRFLHETEVARVPLDPPLCRRATRRQWGFPAAIWNAKPSVVNTGFRGIILFLFDSPGTVDSWTTLVGTVQVHLHTDFFNEYIGKFGEIGDNLKNVFLYLTLVYEYSM